MVGWYVANKGTGIVVSGPFEDKRHAERDRVIIAAGGDYLKLVHLGTVPND